MKKLLLACSLILSQLLSGCMTVPNEVVQLASMTTSDTRALHDGYRTLVRDHFAALRKVREREISEQIFMPFIEDSIKEAQLEDVIAGKKVYDPKEEKWVPPTPGKEALQKLQTIDTWVREVAEFMDTVRKQAFEDLDKSERELLDQVDAAFGNVVRGGTTVHAYLLSLQKVEAAQNDALKAVGLGGLPAKLNAALAKASDDASKWTAKVDTATKKVDLAKSAVDKGKKKIKGN